LRRNESPRAPQVRQAQPATSAVTRDAAPVRNDRPRVQEPQTTQPRSEPRTEAGQPPKTEPKQAKKKAEARKEDKKEDRKQ
jgi:hypothetical protein